jgi:CHASE3 domain sensor protein
MDQTIVNWMLAGFGGLIGFLLNAVWQAVKDLQKADKDLTAKVAEIEVLVAGAYVKKDDLEKLSSAIFAKLDRIEDKLDGKVDKL